MKILHLINDLSSGGAESLLKEIVPLQKKYDDISILTLSNEISVFDEELKKNKVNIINTKFTNNVYNPLQIFEIYKHIKEYDIIHVHLFPSFYWAALANLIILKNKTKLIVTEHNTSNNRRDKNTQ